MNEVFDQKYSVPTVSESKEEEEQEHEEEPNNFFPFLYKFYV